MYTTDTAINSIQSINPSINLILVKSQLHIHPHYNNQSNCKPDSPI